MAEHPKLQTYETMAVRSTATLTGSFDTWAAFLRTASRLYKYSFWEQLLIHVQRPDATACAGYRLWSEKMNRHVRYGAKGIAIISQVNGSPTLRYVFDVSDTRPKANARTPWLWQYREEHQAAVSRLLTECFSVPADKGVSFQLAAVAAQFARKYWETCRERILGAVRDTLLQKYGEADADMAFQDAVAASVSYVLLCRCGLHPEQFFDTGDFSHVYECRDYESVLALGTAVSEVSATLLLILEHTIKQYERDKRANAAPPPAAPEAEQQTTEYPPEMTEVPDVQTPGTSVISPPEDEEQEVQQEISGPPLALRPTTPPAMDNFRITDDHLGEGGPKARSRMNMEALKVLNSIETDGRTATLKEQEILSRYVGWGGIPEAFDPEKPDWAAEYQKLKDLLTDEEYKSAMASTLNAHYTSPVIIRAIYAAVQAMGFKAGNILESSCGIGNFFGCLPESMAGSRLYGVELDGVTARIARQLYPQAHITAAGFETTDRRDFYDLAVGNVPFGQYQVNDPAYSKLGFNIHNYFFAKALDQLRPGGILAFVTSRYTMDSKDSAARKYLAERANLLGAIRLPNNAFRANAGTDVVSDIIFLQKSDKPIPDEPEWVQTVETEGGFHVNQYFLANPDMVLGTPASESTR